MLMQPMTAAQQNLYSSHHQITVKELYTQRKHCSRREGPEDFLFEVEGTVTSSDNEPELPTKIDSAVFWAGNWNKDIEFVHNQGLQINDDNDPAPQNTPQDHISFAWGCNDIDWRATLDPIDQDPNFQGWWKPAKKMLIDNFKKMTLYIF